MWGPGFNGRNAETKQKPLTFNKYLCTQCYIHVLYSSTQEFDDWRLFLLLRTWNCAFAIAVRCMVVVVKTSLETHINCLLALLDLLQSSKAIQGTHTVIGHVQVFFFLPPETRLRHFRRSRIQISTKRKCHTGRWKIDSKPHPSSLPGCNRDGSRRL